MSATAAGRAPTESPEPAPEAPTESRRLPPWVAAAAGPVLIVGSVLVVLHGLWLHPKLTNQQVDLFAFWMPRWCAMGNSVTAGHIPTWLPNQFGGVPFVSDPQSGWLYLPATALFSAMSCTRAMGLFIVLQPILGGLGLYGFFRHEGVGRPAATVGGLTLALAVCGGSPALSMPFSGTLAWTGVALYGASGYVWARTPLRIAGWVVFTGLAVSQIAAAHLTDGLLLGAILVGLYVVARAVAQARSGWRSWGSAFRVVVGPALVFPLLSAAALIPRLDLLPRTSIGQGYRALGALGNRLSHTHADPPLYFHGLGPWWGTSFARGPGGYVGALAVLLIPMAFSSKRFRWPAIAFALAGFVGWALNLDRLIASPSVRRFALDHSVGELWLRSPDRFRYLVLFAFPVLAGYGLQAWLDRPAAGDLKALLRRALWFVGPVAVFVVGPLIVGARAAEYGLFLVGAVWTVALLMWWSRGPDRLRRPIPAAVPLLLALELGTAGLVAQSGPIPKPAADRLPTQPSSGLSHAYPKFHAPYVDPAAYTTPGPIGRALLDSRQDGGRYLTFDPYVARSFQRGFLFQQSPSSWGAYENGRSVYFGLEEVQGYSPVQLDRYWRLVRAMNDTPIFYNSAAVQTVNRPLLDLFGVEWLIEPSRRAASLDTVAFLESPDPVAKEGRYSLFRVANPAPRASLVFDVRPVAPGDGLRTVIAPSFDPVSEAIVEGRSKHGRPVVKTAPGTGTAVYQELSAEHVRVRTSATAPGLVVIRNAWDENWQATVDGKQAKLFVTDYMMQGVAVPAGKHVVEVTYLDRAVATGLLVAGAAWLVALLVLGWLWLERAPVSSAARPGSPVASARPR